MPGPPLPFSWQHLNYWNVSLVPLVIMVIACLLYAEGMRRVATWPTVRAVWFVLGIVVTFCATQSIIGAYDMVLFSDHMIEHLMLIMVAAPIFCFAAPLDLLREAGGPRVDAFFETRPLRVLLHPLFAFALYAVVIPLTHLTGFFNLMLTHEWIHHSEQVLFLVVGYLFFRPAFGVEKGTQMHPGLRIVYVMAAVPVDTITGLTLNLQTHNPFPAYSTMDVGSSTSILQSLHLGGGIMWIGGDALMLLWCIPIALTWVRYETKRTGELDAELDALGI